MKPRAFWMALLLTVPLVAGAAATEYTEGIDYASLVPPQPTSSGDKVEVVEMFWYGCPHCYTLDPYIKKWLKTKPAYIDFVRIPAIFSNKTWGLHAAAFYTAEALGIVDKIHDAFFDAIHRQHRRLATESELADFFAEHGVDRDVFTKTFHSFAVQTKVRRSADLSKRYGLDGVPAMIVDGKYRVDGGMAGSYANMLKIVDYLAQKEEANRKAARR